MSNPATEVAIEYPNHWPITIRGATPISAGVMSAADKAKLDGIPAGGGTLHSVYASGASQADNTMNLTAAGGGVFIYDNVVPIAVPLLKVADSTGLVTYVNITPTSGQIGATTTANLVYGAAFAALVSANALANNSVTDVGAALSYNAVFLHVGDLGSGDSLNTKGLIQPLVNNVNDIGASGKAYRNGYFATSVTTPLVDADAATALSIGTVNATAITIAQASVTSTFLGPETISAPDATGVLTVRDSPAFTMRGTYWTGAVTANTDAVFIHDVLTTGPTSALRCTIDGTKAFAVTTTTTSGGVTGQSGTIYAGFVTTNRGGGNSSAFNAFDGTNETLCIRILANGAGGNGAVEFYIAGGAMDARLYRSGAKVLTVDDGAGGAATLNVISGITSSALDTSAAGTLTLGGVTATAVQVGRSGQSLGLYGTAPVVKYNTTGTVTGFTANASANAVFNESTFTGNSGATAYTISDIVRALKLVGVMTA